MWEIIKDIRPKVAKEGLNMRKFVKYNYILHYYYSTMGCNTTYYCHIATIGLYHATRVTENTVALVNDHYTLSSSQTPLLVNKSLKSVKLLMLGSFRKRWGFDIPFILTLPNLSLWIDFHGSYFRHDVVVST